MRSYSRSGAVTTAVHSEFARCCRSLRICLLCLPPTLGPPSLRPTLRTFPLLLSQSPLCPRTSSLSPSPLLLFPPLLCLHVPPSLCPLCKLARSSSHIVFCASNTVPFTYLCPLRLHGLSQPLSLSLPLCLWNFPLYFCHFPLVTSVCSVLCHCPLHLCHL